MLMKEKEWDIEGPWRRCSNKAYIASRKHNDETMEFSAFKKTETFIDYSPLFEEGICFYAALVVSLIVSKFKIDSLTGWKTFLKNRFENGEVNQEKDFYGLLEEGMHPYQIEEQRSMIQQLKKPFLDWEELTKICHDFIYENFFKRFNVQLWIYCPKQNNTVFYLKNMKRKACVKAFIQCVYESRKMLRADKNKLKKFAKQVEMQLSNERLHQHQTFKIF